MIKKKKTVDNPADLRSANVVYPLGKTYNPTDALRWQSALYADKRVRKVYVNDKCEGHTCNVFTIIHSFVGDKPTVEQLIHEIIKGPGRRSWC